MTDLHFTYDSLLHNKESPEQYDNILMQFFNSQCFDEKITSEFVNDPDFPNLVQCILFPLLRYPLPSPSEAKPDKIIFECIQFLTSLAMSNPLLLNLISANVPFDSIINMFFKFFNGNTDIEHAGGSVITPILKFLSVVSISSELKIENTDSIDLLFRTMSILYAIPEISHYSVSIMCGFIHNSPVAASYLKKTFDLLALKNDIGSQLTSDDPSIVISSLCLLVLLFPNQIDAETSYKVAISSFNGKASFLVPYLSSIIILELSERVGVSTNDIMCLLKAALNGGSAAYYVYTLLSDLGPYHDLILKAIHETNSFYTIVDSMLSAKDGFVSVAGAQFLSFYFYDKDDFQFSCEIIEPFEKAMNIVLSSPKLVSLEKKEAAVLLMRLMIQAPESVTFVLKILQEHEEDIFLDFQRQTELTNSYISIQYFLLLYESSEFLPHWKAKLIDVVAETPFSALIIHVIIESRNRPTISDALRAQYIVANALINDVPSLYSPFYDSLVSAMLLLNTKKYNERKQTKKHLNDLIGQYQKQLLQVEQEKNEIETELFEFQSENDITIADLSQQLSSMKAVSEVNKKLRKQIKRGRLKIKELQAELDVYDDQCVDLQKKIDSFSKQTENYDELTTAYNEKLQICTTTETKLKQIMNRKNQLQNNLREIRKTYDREKKETDGFKRRYDALKQEIAKYKSKIKEMNTDIIKKNEENEVIYNKTENLQRKINAHKELQNTMQGPRSEATLEKLRSLLEEVKHEKSLSDRQTTDKMSVVADIQNRIYELEEENKRYSLMLKLIHKASAGPNFIPKAALKLLKIKMEVEQ